MVLSDIYIERRDKMEWGYLGPKGSYSHLGIRHYAPDGIHIEKKTFHKIIIDVEKGNLQGGILPMENSTEGAVTQVMDYLMETQAIKIQGEIILKVNHALLIAGEDKNDIHYILSHPQALAQCREFLEKNHPSAKLIACASTSDACQIAKEKGKGYAAIAHIQAAEEHSLNILNKDIQDNAHNQTRFVIIGKKETTPTGRDKTSMVFSFYDDFPGSLYHVLKEFTDESINLTRIESRPAKTELGKYIFYIDFEGHKEDSKIKRVIKNIESKTNRLKIFGSYPIGGII